MSLTNNFLLLLIFLATPNSGQTTTLSLDIDCAAAAGKVSDYDKAYFHYLNKN
jgi:hypothetical protein